MFIPFDELAATSRLWVYGSATEISQEESQIISKELTSFLDSWEYHQKKLSASFKIFENRFIIVALDDSEHGVGGCSMDGLQRLIQTLEQHLSLSLMNRLNVFCLLEGEIHSVPSNELKNVANADTLFYDLTIQKKSEINSYLKPIKEGWCSALL
tara:strand:- start:537 stop:1001 length:465 start_codon:yes stop_codon:yes gene_type:complete